MSTHIDYDMMSLLFQVSSWSIVPIMTWLVILDSWFISNHINYNMMSLSGQVMSWWIKPIITWLVILDSPGNVKSYSLWYDGSVSSGHIVLNCTNYYMVVQIGYFGSCQIIWIVIWWVCCFRSSHIKFYQSLHGWSDWTVQVISNHIDYDIMGLSGQWS